MLLKGLYTFVLDDLLYVFSKKAMNTREAPKKQNWDPSLRNQIFTLRKDQKFNFHKLENDLVNAFLARSAKDIHDCYLD